MRIVVLTRNPQGIASRFLARRTVDVAGVILDEAVVSDRRAQLGRRWRKLRRVGPTAIPVGRALRRIYAAADSAGVPHLDELDLPVTRVPTLNGAAAREALRRLEADVALSLGNSIIREETFSIPRLGTINVHHGAVPDYRGGPPIFWELADGRETVGFTVHQIDAGVDTGAVLGTGEVEIVRRETLAATIAGTLPRLYDASLDGLERVLVSGDLAGSPQQAGAGFRTTPRLRDYVRVRRTLRP